MKIGFIGAGRVGITLGKYLKERNMCVSGYFSRTAEHAQSAAEFTGSRRFETMEELISSSDAIFLTVPDEIIGILWKSIDNSAIENKVFCHCSGALSSAVFSEIDQIGGFGYSIHPFFAVSDPWNSYRDFNKAFITVEGHEGYLNYWCDLFEGFGHSVQVISQSQKTMYHCAAVFGSNHLLALADVARKMLLECGFSDENADKALYPIMEGAIHNAMKGGIQGALTGPVERGDVETVRKHVDLLEPGERELYLLLSDRILSIGKEKNPERDYSTMEKYIRRIYK